MKLMYIEDIFLEMVNTIERHMLPIQYQDRSPCFSFATTLKNNTPMTEKQGAYMLKLLTKYRNLCKPYFDYEDYLENPIWKNPFRVIDNSKKVWIEQEGAEPPWIVLQFPFQLKDSFDLEFPYDHSSQSLWDRDRRVRKLNLYHYNIIKVLEWCKEHTFEIDKSLVDAMEQIEDIWANQDNYLPGCYFDTGVKLKNASEDAISYFNEKSSGIYHQDLLLAKSMGYRYTGAVNNQVEKIASSEENSFWLRNFEDLIPICESAPGKVAIILDRAADNYFFLKDLDRVITQTERDPTLWRVCFRSSNKEDEEFNKWISQRGFGGKIEGAKYLIFQHRPHKWLFNKENDVTMLVTNNINPPSSTMSRNLLEGHPCVIYVSDVEPTKFRKKSIVEL